MADARIQDLTEATSIDLADWLVAEVGEAEARKIAVVTLGLAFKIPTIVVKTSDETMNTSATLQDDNELFFAIGASSTEIWEFDCGYLVTAANATMDFKMGASLPTGATWYWGSSGSAGSGTLGWHAGLVGNVATALQGPGTAGQISVSTVATSMTGVHIRGIVFGGGTAGNVQMRWSQSTSDAGDLTVKAGSFLRATRLRA